MRNPFCPPSKLPRFIASSFLPILRLIRTDDAFARSEYSNQHWSRRRGALVYKFAHYVSRNSKTPSLNCCALRALGFKRKMKDDP